MPGWLTLKLFYHTADNYMYSEETRYMWTLAEVREYAQMVFDLNNQEEFALHLVADHEKINTEEELYLQWRPYWTRSGHGRLHLKVVAAPAAPVAAPAAPLAPAPESDDEMEVEEEDEAVVVDGVVVDVVVVGIRI